MAQRPTPTNLVAPDFGPNVLIFDSDTPQSQITSKLSCAYAAADREKNAQAEKPSEMASNRCAIFFKPGSNGITYNLTVDVGYYMTVHGLGTRPTDVTIVGSVQSLATRTKGMALDSFWRGAENLVIKSPTNIWAVSQATYLRRVKVQGGDLHLCDSRYFYTNTNYTSGGFVADCVIDGETLAGTQQQFLTRNCTLNRWSGGAWNMVFVGDLGNFPIGSWPNFPYTTIDKTPMIREKPFLTYDNNMKVYSVQVPGIRRNVPTGWPDNAPATSWLDPNASMTPIPITAFYIAKPGTDNSEKLNAALLQGYHLIFTPGIYHLSDPINITWANTVILGLGMATLIPDNGTSAIVVSDVDGVSISGLIIDAGPGEPPSPSLLLVGPSLTNRADHSSNPTALFDICCRVGGAAAGSTLNCVTINSHNVIIDNMWLWRADHGNGVGWTSTAAKPGNPCPIGIIVNGDNVFAYGLFVEHFQAYQTMWNGNGGRVYFYQSEIPYDVPNQDDWRAPNSDKKGYASYKVADSVTTHTAQGLGVYCYFTEAPVQLESAIEAPTNKEGVKLQHMTTVWLDGEKAKVGSGINHVLNGLGAAVTKENQRAQL